MRIISQRYIGDGQFMLQLGGLSSETKPTDAFVATGSQFFEDDTDAVFTFSGLTWNLEKNGQMKDLPVVTATDNGKVLKVANGVWSVGEDGGGEGGGGGAEKFVVTLTQENDTWTADKTVAEIVAADEAGKNVVAFFQYMGQLPTELPKVSWMRDPEGTSSFFVFSGLIYGEGEDVAFVLGQQGDSSDVWQVIFTPIPTSSNAPLIVTLTADGATGNLVGDKTYKEVYDAFMAGRNCILNIPAMLGALAVLSVGYETDYSIRASNEISADGSANDYITVTVGG